MKPITKIASVIFGVVALTHLFRLLTDFQLSVFGYEIPRWINSIGFIIATLLCVGLWKESKSIPVRRI